MNKSPTVAVIGAGFYGLVLAESLAKAGASVTIFESSSRIGGVTKDLEYDHGNLFFAGCHYLQMDYLPLDYDYTNLQIFEHRYSSITDIDGVYLFKKDFEQPLWRGAQTVHAPQGLCPRTPGIFLGIGSGKSSFHFAQKHSNHSAGSNRGRLCGDTTF